MEVCRGGNGVVEKGNNGFWIYDGWRNSLHKFDMLISIYAAVATCNSFRLSVRHPKPETVFMDKPGRRDGPAENPCL